MAFCTYHSTVQVLSRQNSYSHNEMKWSFISSAIIPPTMNLIHMLVDVIIVLLLAAEPAPMAATNASHMPTTHRLLRHCLTMRTLLQSQLVFSRLLDTQPKLLSPLPIDPASLSFHPRHLSRQSLYLPLHTFSNCLCTYFACPIRQLWRRSRGTNTLEVLLCHRTLSAPSVHPFSCFFYRLSQIPDSMDAHTIAVQSLSCRGASAEWTAQSSSIDDTASGIQTIPTSKAIAAHELLTSSPATGRINFFLTEGGEAQ